MSKGWMDKILDNIFDDEWVGKRGEKLTERELKFVQLFGRKGKTLKNIYLPKENGETSEVDVVFITQKGIFVFESKNYSGWIFGDENNRNWTASLPNGQKNQFYNPVMQNKTHMKWMRNFVGEDVSLFSIIVFSERCELKKVTIYSEDVKVIKRDYTYATVRSIWDKNPDTLSDERINELYEKLKTLTNVGKEGNTDYIDLSKSEPSLEDNVSSDADINTSESMICPKCGSKLVLRTAKKGNNVGNQFYGCSNYPKCHFVRNL